MPLELHKLSYSNLNLNQQQHNTSNCSSNWRLIRSNYNTSNSHSSSRSISYPR